jgi:hypothetical protein
VQALAEAEAARAHAAEQALQEARAEAAAAHEAHAAAHAAQLGAASQGKLDTWG